MSFTNESLSTLPILESMVYISLAVKWAMVCGVKDKKVYKHLKKYYYEHKEVRERWCSYRVTITNGWPYPDYEGFIGIQYTHFSDDGDYRDEPTNVRVATRDTVTVYDNLEEMQHYHHSSVSSRR